MDLTGTHRYNVPLVTCCFMLIETSYRGMSDDALSSITIAFDDEMLHSERNFGVSALESEYASRILMFQRLEMSNK